jgi:hypothetical protein
MHQFLAIQKCMSEAFDAKLETCTAVTKKCCVCWDLKEMMECVTKYVDLLSKFEERITQFFCACDKIEIAIGLLECFDYDAARFQGVLKGIQKWIDKMSLSGYLPTLSGGCCHG